MILKRKAAKSVDEERQLLLAKRRRRARGIPKFSTVAVYAAVFCALAATIAIGYHSTTTTTASSTSSLSNTTSTAGTSVDQLVAVQIAANLAESANLSVAANVANLAVSDQIKAQLTQTNDAVISKPQILQPTANSRTIISHTVQVGETVSSIADAYGISTDTVKWANNLTGDYVASGKVLQILPINGVLYTVRSGDTADNIASRYQTDASRVISFNDLELTGLVVGEKIILPDAVLPNTERPGYVAPRPIYSYAAGGWGGSVTFLYWNTQRTTPGNANAWGNCTWYAWEKRYEMGGAWVLPSRALGNAAEWAYSLGSAGYKVNRTPSYGAIMQNGGGLGHVAIVESVADNGDVTVTEMNYGRWYNGVSRRVIPAAQTGNYNYIH